MGAKKARISDKLYTVVEKEEFIKCPDIYPIATTAIETNDRVLPLVNKTDRDNSGVYFGGAIFEYRGNVDKYNKENIELINLSDARSMKELIHKQERVKDINKSILESADDIYVPTYFDTDTAEMRIFKEGIEAKHMCLKNYANAIEESTGSTFNNDRRLIEKDSITFSKMKGLATAFDMEVELIIRDKSENVPNPMNKEFRCIINGGGDYGTN
jgi:hypothetical protein